MINRHVPYQIGTHDREGWRTFQTPGDVCLGCSDPDSGRWVAVSECDTALALFEAEERHFREWNEAQVAAYYYAHRDDETMWGDRADDT